VTLTIKNIEVEQLATELARVTHDTKTGAIQRALYDRLGRVRLRGTDGKRAARILRFMQKEVWPRIPVDRLGHPPDGAEHARILGYGEEER
jgi:antitoxin VapB